MSLKIFDTKDENLKKLSNNYAYQMKIDNETWNNVSQYIYTNMIPSIIYHKDIKNSNIFYIHDNYLKYLKKSEADILSISLSEILKIKFKDPNMLNLLLSTKNAPIIYKSDNDILGIGKDNKGLNLVGNYMIQIRNQYINSTIKEKETENKQNMIYDIYLALEIFNKLIITENIDDLDSKYDGLSIQEIIDKYGREKIISQVAAKNTIIELYNSNSNFNFSILNEYEKKIIDNPDDYQYLIKHYKKINMVYPPKDVKVSIPFKSLIDQIILNKDYPNIILSYVKKNKLLDSIEYKKNIMKKNIFDAYINNFILRKYPKIENKQYFKVKEQLLINMSTSEINELINRIYETKNKPGPIHDEILEIISKTEIPSENYIKNAEEFNIYDLEYNVKQYIHDSLSYHSENDENDTEIEDKFEYDYIPQPDSPTYNPISSEDIHVPEIPKNQYDARKSPEDKDFMKELMEDVDSKSVMSLNSSLSSKSEISADKKDSIITFKNKKELKKYLKNKNKVRDDFLSTFSENIIINKRDIDTKYSIEKNKINYEKEFIKMDVDTLKTIIPSKYWSYLRIPGSYYENNNPLLKYNNLNNLIRYEKGDTIVCDECKSMPDKLITKNTLKCDTCINQIVTYIKKGDLLEYLDKDSSINLFFKDNKPVYLNTKNNLISDNKNKLEFKLKYTNEKPVISIKSKIEHIDVSPIIIYPYKDVKYSKLEDYLYQIKTIINNKNCKLSENIKKNINDKIIYTINWIYSGKNKNYNEKLSEIENEFAKYLNTINGCNGIREYNSIYQNLAPTYLENLIIDELEYPSVSHYLIVKLYTLLPYIKNVKDGYNYILKQPYDRYPKHFGFLSIDDSNQLYFYISNEQRYKKLKELTEIALNKKFENLTLQDILQETDNKNIIWNDFKDHFLGIGKGVTYNINMEKLGNNMEDNVKNIRKHTLITEGFNFVGKYLEILRSNIKNIRYKDKNTFIIGNNYIEFYNDIMFKEWTDSKLKDMCNTVLKFKKYFEIKYNTDLDINNSLTESVINNIYKICNTTFEFNLDNNIPENFKYIIKKMLGPTDILSNSKFMWKYILSFIQFIVLNMKKPSYFDIKKILYRTQNILSKSNNICFKIFENDKVNCIIVAIVNVLQNISVIDKNKYKFSDVDIDFLLDKNDMNLAVSIILNTKDIINFENKKVLKVEKYEDIKKIDIYEDKYIVSAEPDEEADDSKFIKEGDSDNESGSDIDNEERTVYSEGEDNNEYWLGEEGDITDREDSEDRGDNIEKMRIKIKENSIDKLLKLNKSIILNEIATYLKNNRLLIFENINVNIVADYIYNATNFIIEYKMNDKIKNNRINFFSNK